MLTFTDESIRQQLPDFEKTWTIPELLETCDPLPGEPLADRNMAMRTILPAASEYYDQLSTVALLYYDFWKNLQPARIEEQRYHYTTKVTNTYQWELTLNMEGVFYIDLSGEYGPEGRVYEQLHSDFWFCGPLMPIPDLSTRKWLVAHIRNAFLQTGSPASYQHFELFEYPEPNDTLQWGIENIRIQDFIIVRTHGIERGRSNWHDGLVYLNYLSFERFLAQPLKRTVYMTGDIAQAIEKHLSSQNAPQASWARVAIDPKTRSRQLFMDNGGQTHYIHLDGFGDEYDATPAEEMEWRKELLARYSQRMTEVDDPVLLASIAKSMIYNGAENVEDLMLEAAATATPKARQAIAKVLCELFSSEKGAELLISLLEYQHQDDYWRDYVFNSFFRMRNNPTVQGFVVECLRGDNEIYFEKAVDVLRMWGHLGDKELTNKELLNGLNWPDACAGDPDFRQSLTKVINIIGL